MLLYTTVGANDFTRAVRFYDAIFATLGQQRLPDLADGWAGWGKGYDNGYSFWICPPFDGKAAQPGNGTMFSFRTESAAQVRAFHAAGLANGGQDEGPPGTRDYYEPSFYVAYLRDPDGNKLAAVFHHYDAMKDRA
jgi:catechol 2,3-dioxygenase-like lactoylglutathione lyase family enzyme